MRNSDVPTPQGNYLILKSCPWRIPQSSAPGDTFWELLIRPRSLARWERWYRARACCLRELQPPRATAHLPNLLCCIGLVLRGHTHATPSASAPLRGRLSQNSNFEVEWGKLALKSIISTPWWWFQVIHHQSCGSYLSKKADCAVAFSSLR